MEYLFLVLFILYIAPWVLAESIEHRSANAILLLNLGLGWTGIGVDAEPPAPPLEESS